MPFQKYFCTYTLTEHCALWDPLQVGPADSNSLCSLITDISKDVCKHFMQSDKQEAVSKHLQHNELFGLVSDEILSLIKINNDFFKRRNNIKQSFITNCSLQYRGRIRCSGLYLNIRMFILLFFKRCNISSDSGYSDSGW